ncbi:hypothetical protein JCM15579A_27960 [Marinifilum fragile]
MQFIFRINSDKPIPLGHIMICRLNNKLPSRRDTRSRVRSLHYRKNKTTRQMGKSNMPWHVHIDNITTNVFYIHGRTVYYKGHAFIMKGHAFK